MATRSPLKRFWAKVERHDECWLWTGSCTPKGYPQFWSGTRHVYAHRWSYEQFVGRIPRGKQIDHLCRVRNCVNPRHLEPVTHAENLRRGHNYQANKTHCVQGHPFNEKNTIYYGQGYRRCAICRATAREREYAKRRVARRSS